MSKYRKLIVAILGVVIIAAQQFGGIDLGLTGDQILTFAVPILTALGVWAVPNAPAYWAGSRRSSAFSEGWRRRLSCP